MTVTTYDPQALTIPAQTLSVADYQTRAVQRLGEWVHSADAAYAVAERLVQSSFVPVAFKGKPIEATAAILAGSEVGLSPMASLRAFDVIQGQAAPRAITLRAIVQSYGHEVVVREATATRAIVEAKRRGSAEWQRSVWTLDRAKDMQLTGKDNWKKQPGAMLVARATSEVCRLIAADAILGIGYTLEELADGMAGEPVTFEPVQADEPAEPQPQTRRMSRATRVAAGPQAGAESGEESGFESQPAPATNEETGEGITPAQSKMLHASFGEVGITDREQRLAYCRNLIGREIDSSSDLTKAEASRVIDALAQDAHEAGEQE